MDLAASISVAAAQTFATTELLEYIFTSLSIEDLIYAQRVNRKWHDVIAASKKLHPNLFLTAVPCQAYLYWKKQASCIRAPYGYYTPCLTPTPRDNHRCHIITQPHPAFRCDTFDQFKSDIIIFINYADLKRWTSGPLEDTFLTQPPCYKVSVDVVSRDGRTSRDANNTFLTDEEGIRFGALKARARKVAQELQWEMISQGYADRIVESRLARVYVGIQGFVHQRSQYVQHASTRAI